MAEVPKQAGFPSFSTIQPGYEHHVNGILAGEDLTRGDFVYVKASDGRAWKATGAALNEAARARGVVLQDARASQGISIWSGMSIYWNTALANPGSNLFLSAATAGSLADTATTGGVNPIAWVIDATRIKVLNL